MATAQERLDEAQAAYDALVMGKAVAEFRDQNGETIRYSKADLSLLSRLIIDLKAEVAGNTTPSGPMRPIF